MELVSKPSRHFLTEAMTSLRSRGANILELDHPKTDPGLQGDAENADDTRTALKDADVVVQSLGVPVSSETPYGPVDLFSSATRSSFPLWKSSKSIV